MNSTLHASKVTLFISGASRLSEAFAKFLAGERTKVVDSGYTL